MRFIGCIMVMAGVMSASAAHASELRYTFTNPSFGGSSFNGAYLMSSATEQKQFSEHSASSTRDPLDNFAQTVTSSLLNRVASRIADAIYGEDAQDSGHFVIGNTVLDFEKVDDIVTIVITDSATGRETTVELPVTAL